MQNLIKSYQVIAALAYSNQFAWPLTLTEICERLVTANQAEQLIEQHLKPHLENSAAVDKLRTKTTKADNADTTNTADDTNNTATAAAVRVKGFSSQEKQLTGAVKEILQRLKDAGVVLQLKDSFYLTAALPSVFQGKKLISKSQKENFLKYLTTDKEQQQATAKKIKQQTQQISNLLTKLPWAVGGGVTGSLAVNSSRPGSDIDLLIIAKPNRLWLMRAVILVLSMIKGKKKFFTAKKDVWCFNIWLTSNALSLPAARHSIYEAYEAKQINWFFDAVGIVDFFYQQNKWLQQYLLSYSYEQTQKLPQKNFLKKPFKSFVLLKMGDKVLSSLNQLFFLLQRWHLRAKTNIPQQHLTLNQAFLHDNVSYKKYIKGWEKLLRLTSAQLAKII